MNFLLGVLSSIVAVVVIYIIKSYFYDIIDLVFFKVYPNIKGTWKIIHLNNNNSEGMCRDSTNTTNYDDMKDIMTIKQIGSHVSAINKTYQGDKLLFEDKIKGSVTPSRLFMFTYECKTVEHHNIGSAFVRISNMKNEMHGYLTTICGECEHEPASGKIKLIKI